MYTLDSVLKISRSIRLELRCHIQHVDMDENNAFEGREEFMEESPQILKNLVKLLKEATFSLFGFILL